MALLAAGSAVIDVHKGGYGIMYSMPDSPPGRNLPWRGNGLLEDVSEGSISVFAGFEEGPLRMTVEIHDEAPPLELDDWDEVVEVSKLSPEGQAAVFELLGDASEELPLLEVPPDSWVRFRGHARGRDEARLRARLEPDEDPIEEHLLQMWPAPQAEDVCHRLTDEFGQVLRSQMSGSA